MNPVTPVVEGNEAFETVYARNQSEYVQLPVLKTDLAVMSRWKLTDAERKFIAAGGDLFILQLNGGGPLQPILPMALRGEDALAIFVGMTTGDTA